MLSRIVWISQQNCCELKDCENGSAKGGQMSRELFLLASNLGLLKRKKFV